MDTASIDIILSRKRTAKALIRDAQSDLCFYCSHMAKTGFFMMWFKCISGENHMQVGVVNPTYEAENLNNETRYPHLNSRARPAPLPLPMTTKGVESGCDRRTSGCYDELDEDRYTTLKSIGNPQSFDEGACRESEDGMTTLYFCHKPKKF